MHLFDMLKEKMCTIEFKFQNNERPERFQPGVLPNQICIPTR